MYFIAWLNTQIKIKKSKIPPSEVMKIIDEEEEKLEEIYNKNSILPHKADFNFVDNMVIEMYKHYLKDVL